MLSSMVLFKIYRVDLVSEFVANFHALDKNVKKKLNQEIFIDMKKVCERTELIILSKNELQKMISENLYLDRFYVNLMLDLI